MQIPTELVPYCPDDGELMTTNLRADDTFVEDEGWHQAAERYTEFLRRHEGTKTVFLETAVGFNTPVFCILRAAGKPRKTGENQQIQIHSYNKKYQMLTEMECAA